MRERSNIARRRMQTMNRIIHQQRRYRLLWMRYRAMEEYAKQGLDDHYIEADRYSDNHQPPPHFGNDREPHT